MIESSMLFGSLRILSFDVSLHKFLETNENPLWGPQTLLIKFSNFKDIKNVKFKLELGPNSKR